MNNNQIRDMIIWLFQELAKRDNRPVSEIVEAFIEGYRKAETKVETV